MKKLRLNFVLLGSLALTISNSAKADSIFGMANVSAQNLFVPVGFDDNDESVVVLDGYLPNSCYRVTEPVITKDLINHSITVQARARYIQGIVCLETLVPYTTTVKLGVLPRGDFQLRTNEGFLAEPLSVTAATNAGPDDFLYAPVDGVTIQRGPEGALTAILTGRFTNSCMHWAEPRVTYTGKTVQLLPVIEMGEVNCREGEVPFSKAIPLQQLIPGRYLLHVRSLNGESVNNVFSVYEHGDPIF